ncbi:collagen alpha-1(I) chain [Prinia subflava]|uniref:collagen alpha-1(I) chain n=1 Tax=Prinia subflava TaxID=208062 RepID=UPI002FE04A61
MVWPGRAEAAAAAREQARFPLPSSAVPAPPGNPAAHTAPGQPSPTHNHRMNQESVALKLPTSRKAPPGNGLVRAGPGLPSGPAEPGGDSPRPCWGCRRSLLPRHPRLSRASLGRFVPFLCSLRGPPGQLGLRRPRQGRAGSGRAPCGAAGKRRRARPSPRAALGARPGSHPRRGVAGPAGGLTASTACCRMEVNLENILSRDCSSRCREDLESSSMRRRRRSRVRAAYGGLAAGIGRAGAGAASRSPADTVALTPPAARRRLPRLRVSCRGRHPPHAARPGSARPAPLRPAPALPAGSAAFPPGRAACAGPGVRRGGTRAVRGSAGLRAGRCCALSQPPLLRATPGKGSESQGQPLRLERALRSSSPTYDRTLPCQPDHGTECRVQFFLKHLRDADSTTSLGSPFQCLITLCVKKFFLMANPNLS